MNSTAIELQFHSSGWEKSETLVITTLNWKLRDGMFSMQFRLMQLVNMINMGNFCFLISIILHHSIRHAGKDFQWCWKWKIFEFYVNFEFWLFSRLDNNFNKINQRFDWKKRWFKSAWLIKTFQSDFHWIFIIWIIIWIEINFNRWDCRWNNSKLSRKINWMF